MGQQTIGKYRILDDIASGTQGAVFRAFDPESQRIVALKVLHATLIQDQTYIDRFHREASLTASVDHPNVVNIYDVGTVGTQHYIALEFLPESLGGLIESGALPLINAAGLAAGIADGLGAVHELGIVHRDLKPQNVLITQDGTPKVTDFGIARGGTLSTMTATGMIMGTPFYMSPEQAEGNRVDARADVYALGCVLYEMLAGEVPFTGATPFSVIRKHIETTARPIRTIQGEVPQLLAEVIEKAMSKSANDRYANGAEMAQAIRSAVPGIQSVEVAPPRPIVAAPEPPPPPAPAARPPPSPPLSARTIAYISSRSRSSQLLLSLAAAAIIAIVAALATLIATGSGGGSSTRATPLVAAVTPTSTVVAEAAAVTTLPSPAPMPTIVPVAPSPTLIPATPSPVPVPAPTTAATPTAALVPTTSPTMAPPTATSLPDTPPPLPTMAPPTATSLPDTPAPPPTVAPSESVWVPTGSMAGTRRDHAAILLNDGTVLIVGGTSANAERYHPDTGAFSFLGNVPFNQGVRAARLSDGSVLVVGQGANPSAMTYDPSTTEFALTGSLSIARSHSSATLLPDGKVLVAGGQEGVAEGPQSLHVAELYDPATGLFTLTGNLNDHRSGHAAVALPNGKVLIVGGTQTTTPGFGINLTTVELY